MKTFGGLDFALNNAGVSSTGVQLADMTLGEWERAVRVNLTGTFLCMKHALPVMRRQGG